MSQTQKSEIMKCKGFNNSMIISEDTCLDVQASDLEFSSMRDVICSLIETHAKDIQENITNSPIFSAVLKQAADAKYEWEIAKNKMLDAAFPDGHDLVTEWSLNYNTSTLSWNEVPAGATGPAEVKTMAVAEDVVRTIQGKHAMVDCIETCIRYLIEVHAKDAVDFITASDAFKNFKKMLAKAKLEFEQEKVAMINMCFSEKEQEHIAEWSLDYDTCKLSYKLV